MSPARSDAWICVRTVRRARRQHVIIAAVTEDFHCTRPDELYFIRGGGDAIGYFQIEPVEMSNRFGFLVRPAKCFTNNFVVHTVLFGGGNNGRKTVERYAARSRTYD